MKGGNLYFTNSGLRNSKPCRLIMRKKKPKSSCLKVLRQTGIRIFDDGRARRQVLNFGIAGKKICGNLETYAD